VTKKWVPHGRKLTLLATCTLLTACGGGGEGGGANSGGRFQTIDFRYPGGAMLLDGPVALSAVATSGLPVSFASTTPDFCTVSGSQLTLVKEGECRVVASQGGGASSDGVQWAAADNISQLFKVLKKTQLVSFAPPAYVLSANSTSVALSATSPSGLPISFKATTPATCVIEGSNLKLLAKGTCAVTAMASGDANWAEQSVDRFIAVDPLLIADGFAPLAATDDGSGSTSVYSSNITMATKQGGRVAVVPWESLLGGWQECAGGPDNKDWCYRTVSADGSRLTSALRLPQERLVNPGWHTGFNHIDIFTPGLTGFNDSGDTTGGVRVTTETALGFTLAIGSGLYEANKPIVLHLNLGKRNNGCNVELSTQIWPMNGFTSYAVPLTNFAVTNACGLDGITAASLDSDVRTLPNPTIEGGQAPFQAALEKIKDARNSAMTLMKSSDIVQVRFRLMDINIDKPTNGKVVSDLTLDGAITIQ
jgi:hypothetical protein